jgi:hypothetical protein
MNAKKNMIKERSFGVFVSFKSRLLHKHYPSETLENDLQKLRANTSMA